MNPDKLFDYLDGKLSSEERSEIESRLSSDLELQRELAVARQIHLGMRETFDPVESARAARGALLSRRIMLVFGALVVCNVVFGIYAIAFLHEREKRASPNQQNQEQLTRALQNAAATALPTPSLDVDEIKIPAMSKDRDALVNKIIGAAAQSGGSAAKNLTNENGTLIFAEIPAGKEKEFRDKLMTLGAPATKPSESSSNANRIIQIRVVEAEKKQ
jgi:hypothetical protein